jgi:hypothetical protein
VRPAIDHNLAMLCARAGWPEKAEQHFVAAYERHIHMGSPVWQAQTEFEWAKFLMTTGDLGRARTLLAQANERAEAAGAVDIVAGSAELLASIS